jgi:hypothetical protein
MKPVCPNWSDHALWANVDKRPLGLRISGLSDRKIRAVRAWLDAAGRRSASSARNARSTGVVTSASEPTLERARHVRHAHIPLVSTARQVSQVAAPTGDDAGILKFQIH